MTQWDKIFSTGTMAGDIMTEFAEGKLSCENVQRCFRNIYPEASREVRSLIREKGTHEARKLTRKALRRRGLMK